VLSYWANILGHSQDACPAASYLMIVTERQDPTTPPPVTIKVIVIEDQRDIREGLRVLISGSSGYCCIGTFRSVEEALARTVTHAPDVVLLDIGLPGMSGIEGIPPLLQHYPESVIVMLTVYDDDERVFDAICAGASGYLLKKTPPARLLGGLREAVGGGAPLSPEVARRVLSLFRDVRPRATGSHDLTPHELRLLRLLSEGHNYKTAAAELDVSVNTVAFHMKHVYAKLHVHSKSEAVVEALRRRIVL
jgi:DNA-binding NarL/FixJ family response regulator